MNYIQDLRALIGTRPVILVASAVIVTDDEGRILLQHRSDTDDWGIPGGFMEMGETVEAAARREMLEETGLTVGELSLFHIFSGDEVFFEYPNGDQVHNVIICYHCSDAVGELCMDEESKDLRYFHTDALPEKIIKASRVMLDMYVRERVRV